MEGGAQIPMDTGRIDYFHSFTIHEAHTIPYIDDFYWKRHVVSRHLISPPRLRFLWLQGGVSLFVRVITRVAV